jgi:aminoglycoside phosphotransferase (APT) family kinase protein
VSLAGLRPWLQARSGVDDLAIDEGTRPARNGMSNDTLIVRAAWAEGRARREGSFVVRRSPDGSSVYMSYDLEAQYRTMEALQDQPVPVPRLVGYEHDAEVLGRPFYVMHRVEGDAPPDVPPFTMEGWVLEASASDQRVLCESSIEMLGHLHRMAIDDLAIGHLPQGFARLLADAETWLEWAAEGRPYPILEATLQWLKANQPPTEGTNSLNWGDARPGNMLYRDFRPVCILDWEMASVGPAEVDLGWWLLLDRHHTEGIGFARLPGYPREEEIVASWEQSVGRAARDVFYFQVFAGLRFGIIVLRDCRRAIEQGRELPSWNTDADNTVTRLLAQMLRLS